MSPASDARQIQIQIQRQDLGVARVMLHRTMDELTSRKADSIRVKVRKRRIKRIGDQRRRDQEEQGAAPFGVPLSKWLTQRWTLARVQLRERLLTMTFTLLPAFLTPSL